MEQSWAEQRKLNAQLQAQRLRERQAAESAQARSYLLSFVAAAKRVGLEPEALYVNSGDRGHRAKTGRSGWYLKADQSVAVDTEGNYLVTVGPLTLKERLRGVRVDPVDPPLILGKGGRDGEQLDLTDALDARIPSWREG